LRHPRSRTKAASGLTMSNRILLIATVFGVIVPIGFVLVVLWSMIN
jgi:hypothetical protein